MRAPPSRSVRECATCVYRYRSHLPIPYYVLRLEALLARSRRGASSIATNPLRAHTAPANTAPARPSSIARFTPARAPLYSACDICGQEMRDRLGRHYRKVHPAGSTQIVPPIRCLLGWRRGGQGGQAVSPSPLVRYPLKHPRCPCPLQFHCLVQAAARTNVQLRVKQPQGPMSG